MSITNLLESGTAMRSLKAMMAVFAGAVAMVSIHAMALSEEFSSYSGQDQSAIDHTSWGGFLESYIKPSAEGVNLVSYSTVSDADKAGLKAYIDALEAVDPTRLTEDEAFAYWVNLYNAVTIDVILDNYPVKSIKALGSFKSGPWNKKLVTVNGEGLTLNNIEHDILRKFFDEPRVHYAVNCASIGCPNLAVEPYTGADLDAQLEKSARAYVNDPRGVTITSDGKVVLSKIYKWFKEDFGSSQSMILAHVRRYADDDLRAKLADVKKINGYEYDWGLNDAK